MKEKKQLKGFSIFSSGSHLVQRSGTVSAIFVDSHLRNIPVKLFQNLSTDLAEEVVKSLFLFIALAAILFNIAKLFEQFWKRVTQENSCIIISKSILWFRRRRGWSGGAMVLGNLPVPGHPTNLITVKQGPIALAVGAGGGGLDIFTLIYPFSSFSLSLGDGPI